MKIGVVGSGIMGNGIAQVMAQAGFQVVLYDLTETVLEKAKNTMAKNIDRILKKSNSNETVEQILANVHFSTDKLPLKNADVVIEAITEKLEAKQALFKELDELCDNKTIFATNTSSLSVAAIASVTNRVDKVCGMHFFNPVPVMKLVEIVKGYGTSDETLEVIQRLTEAIKKESIVAADSPLFVVNRILVPMINEAIFVLQEGLAEKEDIDKGMVLGTNQPIGPLKLADLIGLDTMLHVAETLFHETGDSKYRPPYLLKQLVRAGNFGVKTGQGFYHYQ